MVHNVFVNFLSPTNRSGREKTKCSSAQFIVLANGSKPQTNRRHLIFIVTKKEEEELIMFQCIPDTKVYY